MRTVKGSLADRVKRRPAANGASLNGKSNDQPRQPASRPSFAMLSSFQPWVPGHLWASAFTLTDNLRRAQGEALEALGYGPSECDHVVIATGPHWRLRDYKGPGAGLPVLIVAAPIKQPYIWDLSPSTSIVRCCLQGGLDVYLLEWVQPSQGEDSGLAGYADQAIGEAVAAVTRESGGTEPVLMGHSLGGTFAAIYGALEPRYLRGLVLLGAPLSFAARTSRFRDAMASVPASALSGCDPIPGSLITQLCAFACPETFIWSRLVDAAASSGDSLASELHMRIERWALDEMPLSGSLVQELLQWLYREDRFSTGTLSLRGQTVGLSDLRLPILAVSNPADEIAPPPSIKPLIRAMANPELHVIDYRGETGVALQHLGILVGRHARAEIWPKILSWIHKLDRG